MQKWGESYDIMRHEFHTRNGVIPIPVIFAKINTKNNCSLNQIAILVLFSDNLYEQNKKSIHVIGDIGRS